MDLFLFETLADDAEPVVHPGSDIADLTLEEAALSLLPEEGTA